MFLERIFFFLFWHVWVLHSTGGKTSHFCLMRRRFLPCDIPGVVKVVIDCSILPTEFYEVPREFGLNHRKCKMVQVHIVYQCICFAKNWRVGSLSCHIACILHNKDVELQFQGYIFCFISLFLHGEGIFLQNLCWFLLLAISKMSLS